MGDEGSHPAYTFPMEMRGDHDPALLVSPCGRGVERKAGGVLKVKGPSAGRWLERDEELSRLLGQRARNFYAALTTNNSTRALQLLMRALGDALKDLYTRRGGVRRRETLRPIQAFC